MNKQKPTKMLGPFTKELKFNICNVEHLKKLV